MRACEPSPRACSPGCCWCKENLQNALPAATAGAAAAIGGVRGVGVGAGVGVWFVVQEQGAEVEQRVSMCYDGGTSSGLLGHCQVRVEKTRHNHIPYSWNECKNRGMEGCSRAFERGGGESSR